MARPDAKPDEGRPAKGRTARRPSARAKPESSPAAPTQEARAPRAAPVDGNGFPPGPREPNPLYELEETVDRLLQEAGSITGDPRARRRAAEALTELAAQLGDLSGQAGGETGSQGLFRGARDFLSSDADPGRWGRLTARHASEEVDDFGLDPAYERRLTPLLDALYQRWFRVTVDGVEKVPADGRAMIVANHGGALPWDGLMVRTAVRLEHPERRRPRWLAEDFVYHMPFLGVLIARIGAVRACPENAERLLGQEEVLTVFPEGIKGVGKPYRERYRLQRFGRGGYVKLALRTGTPIVPAGIVGAEEAYPLLVEGGPAARLLGLPFLPVTPTFPWLGPLGLVPLPSRWAIVFGDPIDVSEHGPDAADDAVLVHQLNDHVRSVVEDRLREALARRGATFA